MDEETEKKNLEQIAKEKSPMDKLIDKALNATIICLVAISMYSSTSMFRAEKEKSILYNKSGVYSEKFRIERAKKTILDYKSGNILKKAYLFPMYVASREFLAKEKR